MTHNEPYDKDQIRARLSLQALAEEAGARFHNLASRCPLHHGDNPNAFHLYDHGRKWHCFTRCPEGENDGDLFKFYMRWKQVDFATALRRLAERAGVHPAPPRPKPHTGAEVPPAFPPPSPAWQERPL